MTHIPRLKEAWCCPVCKSALRSVSATTHGCYKCQKLFLRVNGQLKDYGDWAVAGYPLPWTLFKRIVATSVFIAFILAAAYALRLIYQWLKLIEL